VVELTSGRDVVLCGSHARRYAPQLLEAGATIVGDYSFEAGLRPSRDIVLAAPVAEGEPAGDKQGRDRQGRWQRFLRRFKKT
jgi:hypothetical protein